MRNPNRIKPYCQQIAKLWITYCPEWQFSKMITVAINGIWARHGDIFYPEDDKLLEYFKEYFRDNSYPVGVRKKPEKEYYDILERFATTWEKVPDWRFGQFISNTFGCIQEKYPDAICEDEEALTLIEDFFN